MCCITVKKCYIALLYNYVHFLLLRKQKENLLGVLVIPSPSPPSFTEKYSIVSLRGNAQKLRGAYDLPSARLDCCF